jgi:hypothetical protein
MSLPLYKLKITTKCGVISICLLTQHTYLSLKWSDRGRKHDWWFYWNSVIASGRYYIHTSQISIFNYWTVEILILKIWYRCNNIILLCTEIAVGVQFLKEFVSYNMHIKEFGLGGKIYMCHYWKRQKYGWGTDLNWKMLNYSYFI